jgi:23S rRNA (uracil1939-C5)-methyltransferase
MAVWDGLRANWGTEASLLPGGREFRVTLRDGLEGVSLSVRGGKGVGAPEALLDLVPGLVSIWSDRKGGGPKHLAGEKSLLVQWGKERLELPGGGFIQVNQSAGEALYEYVLDQIGEVGGKRIIDAYCGAGVLGRALARQGGDVAGIDSDGAGTSVGSSLGPNGFSFISGRVEDELEGLLPADILILNPPRDGLAGSIPPVMTNHPPAKVIYVSCDPATLARDLKRLGGSFRVESARSFDLFPQTAHVETVVTLRVGNGQKP